MLPSVNLGPHRIPETIRDRNLNIYIHLDRVKYSSGMKNFLLGACGGAAS